MEGFRNDTGSGQRMSLLSHDEITISCWRGPPSVVRSAVVVTRREEYKAQDMEIEQELVRIFGRENVHSQWFVCKDATDDIRGRRGERERYCPIIDFIVGPLNISRDDTERESMKECYRDLVVMHRQLLENLTNVDRRCEEEFAVAFSKDAEECQKLLHAERDRRYNKNPRGFLAIEVERQTKHKHVLGGIVHASGLGKVGIILSLDDPERYRSIMKIRRYLRFLVAAKKLGDDVTLEKNTVLLQHSNFIDVLKNYKSSLKEYLLAVILNYRYFIGESTSMGVARDNIFPTIIEDWFHELNSRGIDPELTDYDTCKLITESIDGFLIREKSRFDEYEFDADEFKEFYELIKLVVLGRLEVYFCIRKEGE